MENEQQKQEKLNKAYELRLSGRTFREIGKAMGVSHVTARNWITEHMESVALPLIEEVRKQELDRMLRMIDRLEDRAIEGDDKAIGLMLKTSESMRKLLGADMPTVTVTEHKEVTQTDLAIQELIKAQSAKNQLAKDLAAAKTGTDPVLEDDLATTEAEDI